jgi:hypothetical protein
MTSLPSPLYGLYRSRGHLSALMITVIYAIFAGGTIGTLLRVWPIAARIGRRGVMYSAVATMMAAAGLLAAWPALPGLLIGRLLTGVSVGLAAGTAITYLVELRLRANPTASIARARTIGTSVNVGALGVGPLVGGLLAQWGKLQLTLPYLVMLVLGAIALVGLWVVPETGAPAPHATPTNQPTGSRSARLPIPAAAGLRASRVLALGTISMLVGLALLVASVRLSTPSLALFLIGGSLIGAGAGAVFKGTTGLVLEASPPESRLAMTSDLLIALFVGLSVPVIGAGVAFNLGASVPDTVLGFAILVGLGVAISGWALLRRRA